MAELAKVQQFCPSLGCEFWEDYPNGQVTKLGRKCLVCTASLVIIDPRIQENNTIPMVNTQVEINNIYTTRDLFEGSGDFFSCHSKCEASIFPEQNVAPQNPTNYFNIRFNTLILDQFWQNIDAICLRIGTEYFGNFNTSIVSFSNTAEVNLPSGNFVLINGTLQFPISCFLSNISINFAYKYYIYFKNGEECFENLYHPHEEVKRYFSFTSKISERSELIGRIHQQYDIMILPDLRKKDTSSIWSQLVKTVSYSTSHGSNVPFYNINERRLISLQALLPRYYNLGHHSDCKILEDFLVLFTIEVNELSYFHIENLNKCNKPPHYWDHNLKDISPKLLDTWIKTILISEDSPKHPIAIMHHFYLACYLIQYYSLINEDLNDKCIRMVEDSIEDILRTKSYLMDNSVFKTNKFRDEICKSVLNFIFSKAVRNKYPEKLLVLIPIYHAICTSNQDYQSLHENLDYSRNEYWGFPKEEFLHSSNELLFNSFQRVFDLMKYDKLLPYSLIIYTLNDKNANSICEHFADDPKNCPLSAIMSALLYRLLCASKKKKGQNTKYDDKLITEVLRSLNCAFKRETRNFDVTDINRLTSLTIILTDNCKHELFNSDQFDQCLKLLSQSTNFCLSDSGHSPQIDTVHLFNLLVLKRYPLSKSIMYYADFVTEIKFWEDSLLNYPFQSLFKINGLIEYYLTKRFRDPNIPQQYIIDIFIQLHNDGNHLPLLQDLFRKELAVRLQGVRSTDKSSFVRQPFEGQTDPGQLIKLNKIFSRILLEEELEIENNPVHHFISWPSWGTYFSLLNSKNIDQIISQEAKEMLELATIHFHSIIQQIIDFSITGQDFKHIQGKPDHFLELVETILGVCPIEHQLDEIQQKLHQCLEMFEWVRDKQNILITLNTFLENLDNFNYKLLSDSLCHNIEEESLNSICVRRGTSYSLNSSSLINEIIDFQHINSICIRCDAFSKSRIILKVFNESIEHENKPDHVFNIKIFHENLWLPSINYCLELLQKLIIQTALISEIAKYFKSGEELQSIMNELNTFYSVCNQYQNNNLSEDNSLLLPCAQRIQLYFNLQQCSEAAILITKLRDELLIRSNFEIIESLKNISHTFKSKQLKEVKKVSATASYLGSLTKPNLDVIQAIIDRIDFIMWIRSNLKDLNELKTFVDISLTTCGGNPVDVDRITCLSSVCTNFAPIIFQIDENTSYETLIARCRQVMESVERNKELTKLLRQVGENVTFWEEMKQSHGPVEETTLMQLASIMKSGQFDVKLGDSLNLCDIVSLSVERENGEKRLYSLEQLREFRSKLMLVVSKTELPGLDTYTGSYENSQLFTHKLDTLTEIATIVIQLAETGNQHYLKYELHSDCNQQEDTLMETKDKLRNTLEDWRANVEEARNRHYFLNYYTISQIVYLQKGIKSFIEEREDRDLEQLYHLLGLLNPDVSKQDIQLALQHFVAIPKHNPTKVSSENPQDFSKQSLSTAIPIHYSHITPIKPHYKPAPNTSFSSPIDDETDFPQGFSSMQKELAQEVSEELSLKLELVIRGIICIGNENEGIVPKNKLLIWCLEHEADSDAESTDEVSVVDSSVESLQNPRPTNEIPTFDTVLDINQLGSFLEDLFQACVNKIRSERELPYNLKSGSPNLIVIPSAGMLEFVLSLYMSDNDKLPLPYYHEILICTPQTRLEEIEIFWRRAVMIPDRSNLFLFCLIGIENLSYDVAVQAVAKLKYLQQSNNIGTTGKEEFGYKLILICSEEREGYSYMAAALDDCKVPIFTTKKSSEIKDYLCQNLSPVHRRTVCRSRDPAWMVDRERKRVRLVVSDSVGAGKSLYINNLKSDLLSQGIVSEEEMEQSAVTVAIHGKQASEEHLAAQLLKRRVSGVKHGVMYHVDIASTVQLCLEPILFKLLILGGICKRSGELWHSRGRDYYVIEMTLSSGQNALAGFTRLYPNVQCIQAFNAMIPDASDIIQTIDFEQLRNEQFQRVGSYLTQLENNLDLDAFIFQPSGTVGRLSNINNLNIILKYCGILQPSWSVY